MANERVRPMLAASKYQKAGDLWAPKHEAIVEKHLATDQYMIMEPKWDGFRMLHHEGIPMSRSGEPLANEALQQFVADTPQLAGIDGELLPGGKYSDASFRTGMSQLRTRDGNGEMTIVFYDCILKPNWPYMDRLGLAVQLIGEESHTFEGDGYSVTLQMCPYVYVASLDEIYEQEAKYIEAGYEGGILRRINVPYKYNRATALGGELVKIKRGRNAACYDAIVEGFEEGMQNGNEATESALGFTKRSSHKDNLIPNGRLGALHIRWVNGPYEGKRQKVGVFRGLSHEDLADLWETRDSLIGDYCEVSVDGATGGYDVGRCPVWLRWRPKEEF
jgi:ATP-dependent DNA ligase